MRRGAMALGFVLLCGPPPAHGGVDQRVLGNRLLVVDPGTPARRRVVLRAREPQSDNVLVGDPTTGGATISIDLAGDHPTRQLFTLPSGTSASSLEPFWTHQIGRGFTYRDRRGENGPVKLVQIRLVSGVFQIKASIEARLGAVDLTPPDIGTGACAMLTIDDGDSYSVAFVDGSITNNGPFKFKVSRPTQQQSCIASTTSSTTTSTTIDAPSTSSTTEVTTSTTTTSTIPRPVVWVFGNSIAARYCPVLQSDHPEWNVVCVGLGGERTTTGLPRLIDLLGTSETPAVVVIEEGVNDAVAASGDFVVALGTLTCNVTAPLWIDATLANLAGMRAAVRMVGGVPVVASMLYQCPVPSEESCMALPLDDPGACPQLRCFFDDACALSAAITSGSEPWVDFVLPSSTYFADLLHPNDVGTAFIAAQAAAAIAAHLP